MKHSTLSLDDLCVRIRLSSFEKAGAGEYHVMIEGTDARLNTAAQFANMAGALNRLVGGILPAGAVPVLERWFLSDAANQGEFLRAALQEGSTTDTRAVSIVGQSPLNGTRVSLWCWFVEGAHAISGDGKSGVSFKHSSYRHLLDTGLHSHTRGEEAQTEDIFRNYNATLRRQGLTLAKNVIRTWIFIQGIDTRYGGMVRARRAFFADHGLTPQSHFIASTGIEGAYIHPDAIVFADIYAIEGLHPGQIGYLKGSSHLNPTHEYGVTFERATTVDYGDRRHILVSGTASIDNRGRIAHPLDVTAQTGRVLENIGALLAEGEAAFSDIAQMIVYLRDGADHLAVSDYLDRHCPGIPRVIVRAPVCRPGWLVEIECIAIRETIAGSGFEPF
jgi:enamine deaminase RidA (YjgF/YER057c/UK114 family)